MWPGGRDLLLLRRPAIEMIFRRDFRRFEDFADQILSMRSAALTSRRKTVAFEVKTGEGKFSIHHKDVTLKMLKQMKTAIENKFQARQRPCCFAFVEASTVDQDLTVLKAHDEPYDVKYAEAPRWPSAPTSPSS